MVTPLVVVILATLIAAGVAWAAARNALALKRDIDRRFDDIRRRLERDATATIDGLLDRPPDDNG